MVTLHTDDINEATSCIFSTDFGEDVLITFYPGKMAGMKLNFWYVPQTKERSHYVLILRLHLVVLFSAVIILFDTRQALSTYYRNT